MNINPHADHFPDTRKMVQGIEAKHDEGKPIPTVRLTRSENRTMSEPSLSCPVAAEDFTGFPKIARFARPIVITEKLDGTNSQIFITDDLHVFTGSKNRWITPANDNYGFARWAWERKRRAAEARAGPALRRVVGQWHPARLRPRQWRQTI